MKHGKTVQVRGVMNSNFMIDELNAQADECLFDIIWNLVITINQAVEMHITEINVYDSIQYKGGNYG